MSVHAAAEAHAPLRAPARHAAEEIAEYAPAAEDVAERREDILEVREVVDLALDARLAVAVVAGALLVVGEDLVGLGRLLEALLGLPVAGVAVGMVLHGELAERAAHVVPRGVPLDAQHLVVVAVVRH